MTPGFALLLVLAQATAARPTPVPTAAPTAIPTPASKLSGGFGQKPATSGKARVVITDDTMNPTGKVGTLSVAGKPIAPHAGTPASSEVPTPLPPDDETIWKRRVARLRAELEAAQKEYDAASSANTVITWGDPSGWEYQQMMAARNAALTPYRVRLSETSREIAGLPDECRRTPGCQPGWVR